MDILLNEPYYSGSHKYWADQLVENSYHNVQLFQMKGRFWKWRLQGAAIHLAALQKSMERKPSAIICSSMMDVSMYKVLLYNYWGAVPPIVYYVHENQLTYPYSSNESRSQEDFQYGFMNFKSCLAAELVLFNSNYHKQEFLSAIELLLKRLPDYSILNSLEELSNNSKVLPVGLDFKRIAMAGEEKSSELGSPTLLWNHRWDEDKNPKLFLKLCRHLKQHNIGFNLILLGQMGNESETYRKILEEFANQILHSGYVGSYNKYIGLLKAADILPVSSDHDFYGLSVLEALACKVYPILPFGKVYHEYVSDASYFYKNQEEFFGKVKNQIRDKNSYDSQNLLNNHSIYKVMETMDLHINNLIT